MLLRLTVSLSKYYPQYCGWVSFILQPVSGAARTAPPWWCGDPGHWVPGDEGEDSSGKLGQPWGQKEEGGAPGGVTPRSGKRVSMGPQGPFTRLQAS